MAERAIQAAYEERGYDGKGYDWPVEEEERCNELANSTDGELSDVGDILTPDSVPPNGATPDAESQTRHNQEESEPGNQDYQDILAQLRSGSGRFELLLHYCQGLNATASDDGSNVPTPPPPTLERAAAQRTYLSQEWQQRYSVASFLLRRNPGCGGLGDEAREGRLGLSLLGLPGSGKSTLMNVLAGKVVSPVSNSQGNADLKEAKGCFKATLDETQQATVAAEYRLRDIPGFLGTQEQAQPSGRFRTLRSWLGLGRAAPTCASAMPVNAELGRNYLRRYGVLGGRGGAQAAPGSADVVALVLNDRAKHLDVLLEPLLECGAVVVLVVTHSAGELACLERGDTGAYLEGRAERLLGLLAGSMQAGDRLLATALSLPAFFVDSQHANTPTPHQAPARAAAARELIAGQLRAAAQRREMGGLQEYLATGAVERRRLFRFVDRKLEERLRTFHAGRSWASFLAEVLGNAAALGGGPLGPVAHSFLMSLLTLAGMMDAAGLLPPGPWQTRLAAHLRASVQWESLEKASQTSVYNALCAAVKGGLGLAGAAAWDDLIGLAAREALTTMVPFFGTALYALTLSYMRRRMAWAVAQKARLVHRRWIMENL